MEMEGVLEGGGIYSAASWHSQIRIMELAFIACVFILEKRSAVTQQRLSGSGSECSNDTRRVAVNAGLLP